MMNSLYQSTSSKLFSLFSSMSGRFDPDTGRPFPYLVNLTDDKGKTIMQWSVARLCYHYVWTKLLNNDYDDLPFIGQPVSRSDVGRLFTLHGYADLDEHFRRQDYREKGMNDTEVLLYTLMCNRIDRDVLIYGATFMDHLIYGKKSDKFRLRCTHLEAAAYWEYNKNVYDPKTICFPFSNLRNTHAMLFVAHRDRTGKFGTVYYKCQIIDSALWHNLTEDSYLKYHYSQGTCKMICDTLNKFYKDELPRTWNFTPDTVANWYLHKLRQGYYHCAMYTCMHMRYFVGTLPLFVSKHEHVMMDDILHHEVWNCQLIDFIELHKKVRMNKMVDYIKRYGHPSWPDSARHAYRARLSELYRNRLHKPEKRAPRYQWDEEARTPAIQWTPKDKMPHFSFGGGHHFNLPPAPSRQEPNLTFSDTTHVFFRGSELTRFVKGYCYGKEARKPGQARPGPPPNYSLIGDYRRITEMPDELNVRIPHGMNAPQVLQFVYEDPNTGEQTILAFRLDDVVPRK